MRALHFMKIDYILTRKQIFMLPLLFMLALAVGIKVSEEEMALLIACSYMIFISSVFSTTVFAYCGGKNRGFLLLLPAAVKDRVAGRFLYGLSHIALLGVLCGVLMGVYRMMGFEVTGWESAAVLWELAAGIVIMTLEYLFFYLFGEGKENWQFLSNIVRVVPGMAMFFAMCHLLAELEDSAPGTVIALDTMSVKLMQAGVIAVALSLILMAAAAAVCVKAIEKRDYA